MGKVDIDVGLSMVGKGKVLSAGCFMGLGGWRILPIILTSEIV